METRSNYVLVGGITLGLLVGLVAFLVWLAGLGTGATKEYDIFFKQSVDGLNKGSAVSFSGVPSGEIKEIELWKENPQFVRIRIAVKDAVPVLIGTSASIQALGFTGASQIQLSGAVQGAPPISEPGPGPGRVPVIPTRTGGLGALLNNAPQLVERLSTLTERLTELLNDRNQKAFGSILANVDSVTGNLAQSGPDIRATIAETRATVKQAGAAAEQIAKLAGSTENLVNSEGKSMVDDLRKTTAQAQKTLASLDAAVSEARPGLQAISTQTVPEINLLVRDLRNMSEALGAVATKIDQEGAGALIGGPALPDYKPARGEK
jgi:phospholipid/cholesterol/gamma-HCH transport system substrate-binding protein